MPFIPETGEGLPDSTSYASVEEADAYFAHHPYYADNWSDLGVPDRERYLMLGTGQLEAFIIWEGTIANQAQALGWPRVGVTDDEGRIIPSNIVPKQVKIATFEMAIFGTKGDPYAPSSSQGLDRLKIDVIELEFSSSQTVTLVPALALLALRGLGEYAYGSNVRKVIVG